MQTTAAPASRSFFRVGRAARIRRSFVISARLLVERDVEVHTHKDALIFEVTQLIDCRLGHRLPPRFGLHP